MSTMKTLTVGGIKFDIVDDDAVRFSEAQDLTDEQKEQARDNIGATGPEVYIGSGDMPDGCVVQIDPDSDDAFPAVSYKTQVLTEEQKAQARENLGAITLADVEAAQPKLELIENITVEEENIATIVRDGFMLDAVSLVVNCPVTSTTGKIQPRYHYPTASGDNYTTMINCTVTNASYACRAGMDFYKRFGVWWYESFSQNPYWGANISTVPTSHCCLFDTTIPYVNKITLITTTLPVGTTISIYGVRRDEN